MANPNISSAARSDFVRELMAARSAVRTAKLAGDQAAEAAAHHAVDMIKRQLGERGPVWWTDGSPDLNGHMVKNTHYTAWLLSLKTRSHHHQHTQSRDTGSSRMP